MLKPLRKTKGTFTSRLIPQTIFLFAWFLLSGVCYAQTNAQVQVRVFMEGLLKPIPEMVRVRAGTFNQGTAESAASDGPHNNLWDSGTFRTIPGINFEGACDSGGDCQQSQINISQPFEVSRHEITREQFKFFLNSRGIVSPHSVWDDPRYYAQEADHPATHVSWDDAQAYLQWLNRETGQDYRLLSEAEWEYVARAGTTSIYSHGDMITKDQANFNSDGTVPVGSYSANDFGLHDVHGNVWEWVQDCFAINYSDLLIPRDASANETSCINRNVAVVRGGAWDSQDSLLRSTQRGRGPKNNRFANVGFRIAQTLNPLLTIASPQPNTNITLQHEGISGSTQVEVVINVDRQSVGTLELQSDDESIVSASIDDAQINPLAGSDQTTVKFTLTPQGVGNAIVTIFVVDDRGVTNEVNISVEVGASYPEMLRVEEGEYMMGSTSGDIARFGAMEEGPQHRVRIPAFQVSRYEVTRVQFSGFIDSTGHDTQNNDCDWENPPDLVQDDDHPVVCVSWDDAQAYVDWLNQETGDEGYRLLSESEWEYAARAETTTTYSFGNTLTPDNANYNSDGTVPVGSYSANDFRLHDVHGNVEEWVQDCWHSDYTDAPNDGSAWEDSCDIDVDNRVIRGGSWESLPADIRSASRAFESKTASYETLGFRVARSPLTIASPRNTRIRLTLEESPTAQVQVVIGESDTTVPVTMTLQLDSGGESVVSTTPSKPIIFPATNDDSTPRTASFGLTAKAVGETVVTIVVEDELGHQNKVQIPIEVEAIYPQMVRVQRGEYEMGSPSGDERPQHDVTVPGFEVSKHEVTRGQFAEFAADTSYTADNSCNWENPPGFLAGFTQNNRHPVVCVSQEDAQDYVDWLSKETEQDYRLLSESEWEYVARAGTTTIYSIKTETGFGSDTITTDDARYDPRLSSDFSTVAVGSYPANAFGLHDVHGNVSEWVEDCWHINYGAPDDGLGAPDDGSAWITGCAAQSVPVGIGLPQRLIERPGVHRGGGWRDFAGELRSANRNFQAPDSRMNDIGFRVARTVAPPELVNFDNSDLTLFRGDSELATIEIPVTINVAPDTDPITMELTLDSGGGSVVSVAPSGPITVPPASDGGTSRTAIFTLTGTGAGETMLTIVVTDGLGNTAETSVSIETIPTPQMVEVPAGMFTMGSPSGRGLETERPQREVNIPGPFEVGVYEVTREEFKYFLDSPTRGDLDPNPGREDTPERQWEDSNYYNQANFPAAYLTWNHARRYASWLSETTGRAYRLLSEAEWEYAARAGTTTDYHYGNPAFLPIRYNVSGRDSVIAVNAQSNVYTPNNFGLYHVHGNVSEWVEDCWHANYIGAPTDGRAWRGNCSTNPVNHHVYRGGSWRNSRADVRSARRVSALIDTQFSIRQGARPLDRGFRIARTLPITIVSPLPSERYQISSADGSGVADTETVRVDIRVPNRQVNVSMRLQLDADGDSIVSITPASSIAFPPTNSDYQPNGYNMRSAEFTLTAMGTDGSTTLTMVITDNAGNSVATNILVEAFPIPAMTRVSAGSFTMGARSNEASIAESNRIRPTDADTTKHPTDLTAFSQAVQNAVMRATPRHSVTINKAFEVGTYEITNRQFKAYLDANNLEMRRGCSAVSDAALSCATWGEVQLYIVWLNEETDNKGYRLLSEAEWEYVARAGTDTAYSIETGTNTFGSETINSSILSTDTDAHILALNANNPWNIPRQGSNPPEKVGSYNPNRWGLYDVHGNVAEWVEDCWHEDYDLDNDGTIDAPTDGSAWTEDICTTRMTRGGDRADGVVIYKTTRRVGSASREVDRSVDGRFQASSWHRRSSSALNGFRIARDLP